MVGFVPLLLLLVTKKLIRLQNLKLNFHKGNVPWSLTFNKLKVSCVFRF